MATVRGSVAAQSKALSDAATEIMNLPKIAERRYVPLTSAEAVLRYARDFIPSWAGAISIDLLPAALVGIMAVVYGAMRRGEETLTDVDRISAGDMLRALDIQEALAAKRRAADKTEAVPSQPGEVAAEDEPPSRPAPAENVTPLTLGDRKRGET